MRGRSLRRLRNQSPPLARTPLRCVSPSPRETRGEELSIRLMPALRKKRRRLRLLIHYLRCPLLLLRLTFAMTRGPLGFEGLVLRALLRREDLRELLVLGGADLLHLRAPG